MKFKYLLTVAAASVVTAFAVPASAVLMFTLNQNLGGGPFGTVTITQDGANTVDVSIVLNAGVGFVNTGIDNAGIVVSNTVGTLTAANFSGFSTGWSFLGTSGNADGSPAPPAGFTRYFLNCANGVGPPNGCGTGGNAPNPGPLNFTVMATGLLESHFTNPIFVDICTSFTAGSGCSGQTGATWTSTSSTSTSSGPSSGTIPEPASSGLALFGLALLGAVLMQRRRSRSI